MKRDQLYGFKKAKNNIRKEDLCILFEGQTDVIAAHSIGAENVVAPLGTGITDQQVDLMLRYSDRVLFLFDSDKAGQAAVERGFKIGILKGANMFAVTVPEPYKDIDELIQEKGEEVKKLFEPEVDAFTYLISSKVETLDLNNLNDHSHFIKYVKQLLPEGISKQQRDFYTKKIKVLTEIDLAETEDINKNQYNQNEPPIEQYSDMNYSSQTNIQTTPTENSIQPKSKEVYFLTQILFENNRDGIAKLDLKFFQNDYVKEIFNTILDETSIKVADLSDELQTDEAKILLESIVFQSEQAEEPLTPKELNKLYIGIKVDYYDQVRDRLRLRQAIAEGNSETKLAVKITKRIIEVTQLIVDLQNWEKK